MAKFNLKEHIAKNKATFFGSLTEGQFSWFTQDTDQQIGSQDENKIPVYMFDNNGKYYYEKDYAGYGEFGGMDYYELLDKMNGGIGDRSEGIRKAFDAPAVAAGEILFPALVSQPDKFNYKTHDFTKEAEHDPNQSWLSPEEDYNEDLDEGYDEFKRADKGSKDVTAKDKGEEEVYGAGVKKGEEIEKKKLKENSNKPTTVPELIFQIQKKYPRMNWLESELPNNPTFQDVKGTLEDNGYGKIYDEFMGGDMTNLNETNTKMKKSELKAKIKEMIVAEYEKDVNITDENPEKEVDFLAELENMLNEAEGLTPLQDYVYQYEIEISGEDKAQNFLDDIRRLNTPDDVYDYYAYERDWQGSMDDDLENIYRQVKRKFKNLSEADETEKDTAETDTAEVAVDDTENIDTETTAEVDPNVKAVQDSLTQAQAAAQALGDKKLIDQIGNTITFFTRAHVVEKPKGAVSESMFPMLKKILK